MGIKNYETNDVKIQFSESPNFKIHYFKLKLSGRILVDVTACITKSEKAIKFLKNILTNE